MELNIIFLKSQSHEDPKVTSHQGRKTCWEKNWEYNGVQETWLLCALPFFPESTESSYCYRHWVTLNLYVYDLIFLMFSWCSLWEFAVCCSFIVEKRHEWIRTRPLWIANQDGIVKKPVKRMFLIVSKIWYLHVPSKVSGTIGFTAGMDEAYNKTCRFLRPQGWMEDASAGGCQPHLVKKVVACFVRLGSRTEHYEGYCISSRSESCYVPIGSPVVKLLSMLQGTWSSLWARFMVSQYSCHS